MAKKNTIVEDIRLTGGADVEKQFNELGDAGVKAFAELKKAANDLSNQSDLDKFLIGVQKNFKQIQAQAKLTAAAWRDAGKAAKDFARNVGLVGAAVSAAVVGFVALIKGAADAADAQNKAAQAAGLAQDQYAELAFAFKQGNVDAGTFGTAMKKLNQNIVDAAKGAGPGADAFRDIGVAVKDANGNLLPTDVILQRISDKFKSLPDGPAKSALAVKLFGKAGAALIPVLNDGSKAMQELQEQAIKLGLVFTKDEAAIGDAFGDSLEALTEQVDALKNHFGLLFATPLTKFFTGLSDIISKNQKAILDFGTTLSNQLGPLLQDFLNILQGNDSAVVNKNLLSVRDTVVSIGQALGIVASIVVEVFNEISAAVEPLVDLFNAIFGTKFTSQAVVITGLIFALTGGFKLVGLSIKGVLASWGLLVKVFEGLAPVAAIALALIIRSLEAIDVAIKGLIATGQSWAQGLQLDFTAIGVVIQSVWDAILAGATALVTALVTLFINFQSQGLGAFKGLVDGVVGFFTDLASKVGGIIDGIMTQIKAALALAAGLLGFGGGGGSKDSGGSGGAGFAGGGRVRGPGGPVGDKIRAWLSDGEYVVRAKAVRAIGVDTLSAINNMRFTPQRFAMGGLAMASGGSVPSLGKLTSGGPSGRPFNLNIGGEVFEGLIAPTTVAGKLVTFAQTKAVRSAGKRPSWR